MKRLLLVLLAPLLGACSTLITPETIRFSGAPEESRGQALDLLEEAVIQANEFLISEHRLSLPPAHYERTENGILEFVTESRRWPVRIRHSLGGDLVVITGFRAQERDDGFVVGSRPPDEHPEIDNSMFRDSDGDWHSAESIARLILHETAHTVHGVGTVGYWNTVCYYAEAIFLLRSSNHSAERIPVAVSREFLLHRWIEEARHSGDEFMLDGYLDLFTQHQAKVEGSRADDG